MSFHTVRVKLHIYTTVCFVYATVMCTKITDKNRDNKMYFTAQKN